MGEIVTISPNGDTVIQQFGRLYPELAGLQEWEIRKRSTRSSSSMKTVSRPQYHTPM